MRKRLAGELRSAGDKSAAKTLLAARRPTTAAWAMNQLSRREPALVETFLQAGRDLQAAHGKGGPDAREAIRAATRAHRDALAAATDGAMATLESRATDGFRAQILATLHAANVDEAVAEQLEKGRLFREVTGSTGFPEFSGLTLVPDLEPDAAPVGKSESESVPKSKRMPPKRTTPAAKDDVNDQERAAAEKARRAEEQQRAREEAAAAELAERRAEAESAWQDAQDEATDAESAAHEAQERVDQLEHDLDEARRDAKAADEHATSARREAARLARAVMKLQK